MEVYDSVVELIGNTPLVRLRSVAAGIDATVLAKVEYLNPGGSVKDRIATRMIQAAEESGELRPGGTIVEPTSGNTGVGLAIVAQQRGYHCVFVCPDKVSQDKINVMKAYGAEVVVCPTAVSPEHPDSYYSVSDRLAHERPGAWKPNQYANINNPRSHYETTGPEIWRQTDGRVTHFVAGVGTGGTITGAGRYLKEISDGKVRVIGADPEGSVYSGGSGRPYLVEGVGEDFWPETYDKSVSDEIVAVSDADSFQMTRRLAREEGLLVGGSCGMAVVAALRVAEGATPDDGGVMSEQTVDRPVETLLRPLEDEREPRRRRFPFSPWHLVLLPVAVLMLVPLVWMLVTSVETLNETRHFPPILVPHHVRLGNYTEVLRNAPFARWFLNTLIVTVAVVVGNLFLCSLAGYAFARLKFFGRDVVFILVLATLMIPFQVIMIPTFLIVRKLGLIDTLGALILPNLGSAFGIFLLRQFFRTLPIELEEAARIDGASRLGVLFKIVIPLSGPALATLAVILFLWTWNDFLWPLVTIYNPNNMTLQLGLTTFQGTHQSSTQLLMAANVMSMVPILVLFFVAQRYFIRGIATTGLKG